MGQRVTEYLWKVPLCALTYLVGTVVAGAAMVALGLPLPELPSSAGKTVPLAGLVLGSVLLVLSLGLLVDRLRGGRLARGLMLAAFGCVCLGPNAAIEASVFTKFSGLTAMAIMPLLPCVLVGLVTAALFKQPGGAEAVVARAPGSARDAGWQGWLWRVPAAVVSFVLIYFLFGMPVGALVGEYYRQEQFGLILPSLDVVIRTQLIRGAVYLLACLPIAIVWSRSRREFVIVFGIAFFVFTGLFGMLQATWLPIPMRLIHTVELLADGMAYAGVLGFLFVRETPP